MSRFCPLASGSKGNCIYVETKGAKLLIDAGIAPKIIEMRLAKLGVCLDDIDAILISHEHTDHIKGLETLCGKREIPVLANSDTAKGILSVLPIEPKFKIFTTGETFVFADIEIHPFSVQHDTLDPVGFTLTIERKKIGVCTDLGFATSLVISHLQKCQFLYLESNHDPDMVHACSRPPLYKQRVLGNQGHLSNAMCAQVLSTVYHRDLSHVYLAHLSEECNHPELALNTSRHKLQADVSMSIAYQDEPSLCLEF